MVSEKVTEGSERGGGEMNGNGSNKVVVGGVGGGAYRWKNGGGDAVQLKRRRVGLSNGGGSVSDDAEGNSFSEEEEEEEEEEEQQLEEDEDVEEVAAEELSDDNYYEGGGGRVIGGPSAAIDEEDDEEDEEVGEEANEEEEEEEEQEEDEEEQEEEERHHVGAAASMDRHRGGSSSGNRGREPVGFVEEQDDYYDVEEAPVPDSPPVARYRGREREREIEMSSPEEVGGRDVSDSSEEERQRVPQQRQTMSRGMIERGQSSSIARESEARHREVTTVVVPEKPARGMMDTAKRKAPEVSAAVSRSKSGGQPKPKKEKAPAAPRRKANGEGTTGTRERQRFSTDNKARVTLERAREILAQVKAAMMKDPKQFIMPRENHAVVENFSSSEDERKMRVTQPAATNQRVIHHQQQVKSVEKVVKKRSRAAPKGGDTKEATPRKRKTKVEVDHAAEEKSTHRSRHPQVEGHDYAYKMGHFSTSGAEGRDADDRNGYDGEDGYEQQQQTAVVEKKVRKRRKAKEGEDLASATGLCPGSVIRDENWAPPASPFGLIQESLYKDPWKVLLSCMLLNKTAGRQMHKVIWDLFSLCPDAETAINMDTAKIAEKVYSLGLQNKRAKMIQRFSLEYLRGDWTNVTQLHGIGKYAADAYAIFCQGLWREVVPDDLMLNKYWKWLCDTNGQGTAYKPPLEEEESLMLM